MLVYNTDQAHGCNGQHVQGFIAGPGWIIPNSAGTSSPCSISILTIQMLVTGPLKLKARDLPGSSRL